MRNKIKVFDGKSLYELNKEVEKYARECKLNPIQISASTQGAYQILWVLFEEQHFE